ncbi:MAG: hypothetical protein WA618_16890 [Terriglobales bacterium]
MIRNVLRSIGCSLAFAAVVCVSCGWAQIASSSSLLTTDGSASASNISPSPSPNPVTPNNVVLSNQDMRAVPDLPPQPKGKTTLMGGEIRTVDHVRDRIILDIFGGGHLTVLFDDRTHVFSADRPGSLDDLKDGERAYVDTTLDGKDIFARNIRVLPVASGQGNGQIVDYDASRRELILRDTLSPRPVKMHLMAGATIVRGDQSATPDDLQPGTLVTVAFVPASDRQGKNRPTSNQPMVSEVSILALPGATFYFSGQVTFLDLHRGLVVIVDPRDNKSYEVYVDANDRELARKIQEGADVMVEARFNGTHYEARSVTVNSSASK